MKRIDNAYKTSSLYFHWLETVWVQVLIVDNDKLEFVFYITLSDINVGNMYYKCVESPSYLN